MKKLALIFAILLAISGCTNDTSVKETSSSVKTPAPQLARTTNISSGISDDRLSFSHSFDFDLDGQKEDISITTSISSDDSPVGKLNVSLGDYKTELELIDGYICDVYACDMDATDNVSDIAIITVEGSDDPRIRILKYGPELLPYQFHASYGDSISNDLWLGYAVTHYFNVNDDDSITLEMQTPSYGMWSVNKTFCKNSSGIYEELAPEYYEILPDFMERTAHDSDLGLSPEEAEALGVSLDFESTMWQQGFIRAYKDYNKNGVVIKEDDYVRPLFDDGKNNICVERENGEKVWINIEDYLGEFNEKFFFLAG